MKIVRESKKHRLLGILFLSLATGLVFFLSSGIFAEEDQIVIPAPVNEDFLKYLKEPSLDKWRKYSDDGYPLGLIPSPHDISYLKDMPVVRIENLPASYDLRTKGKLTAIRSQGGCGSCWAFATYGSLESFLRPSETWNFSEQNLIDQHGFDLEPCEGGNIGMSTAYLARWSGPIKEEDDPYIYSTLSGLNVRKHVQDVIYIPPRSSSLDNDLIKQAVMAYGAVYVSMYYSSAYYNNTNKAYYNPDLEEGGHAIAIVGWDDNFDKNKFNNTPTGNGAFIVRNSWGIDWGENGYFYVSYYDNYFAKRYLNAVVEAEPSTSYDIIYQYDHLGWTTSLGYGSDTAWFSNIFTATSSYPLIAVSFYAVGSSNDYEIYIYTDVIDNQPRSGALARKETGSLNSPGYFTIPLKSGIALTWGQKFSIVVKLRTKNYNYPIPVEYPFEEYSSRADANAGESFISYSGNTWSDIHISWGGIYANTNVCLKAFAGLNDPPYVSITSPSNGDTISGIVNIQASATDDDGIAKVEFYVDNELKNTDSTSPYKWVWDTTSYSSGVHTIKAKAFDTINQTAEDSIQVTVDQPPQISITSPVSGSNVFGVVPIETSASDDFGINKVQFYVNGVLKKTDRDLPYKYNWGTNKIFNGSYAIKVVVFDTRNQTAQDKIDVIRIPHAPLNFSGTKQNNSSVLLEEYLISLAWQSNDLNTGISKYRVYQKDGEDWVLLEEVNADTFEYWHRNVSKDEKYVYALRAVDNQNNEGESTYLEVQ